MKHILLFLSVITITTLNSRGQTVYFTQNFNTSTNYTTYQATAPTANQFNSIAVSGNTTVNATNNKLQFVKTNATGTNRGGFVRSTNFAGAPTTGAGFMKASMDITISNNDVNVPSGFIFSVGEVTAAPNASTAATTHSNIYINPTATPGEFVIGTGSQDSQPFSGTKTIIWYINNTSSDVGYIGPDGQVNTVQQDFADVWVVDATTKILAINEEPATTPTINLKGFKLANNPNFTATIDVDNIVIAEEKVTVVPKIASITPVPPVTATVKTDFKLLPLPKNVEVTYDDNTKGMPEVKWAPVSTYNQYLAGTYDVMGTVTPINGTTNPNKITVTTTVTINDDVKIVNSFSPNNDGKNDTWVNPVLKFYSESSVEVLDRNGNRLFYSTSPEEAWDGKDLNGQVTAGSYLYIIKIPMLSLEKRGILTVIK